MNINGKLAATPQTGVFIYNVNFNGDPNGNASYYGTILNSNVTLSNSNGDSAVTYAITVYNNAGYPVAYDREIIDSNFYSNQDITYEVSGLKAGDILEANQSKTFNITFKYKNETVPSSNTLKSSIQFKFDQNKVWKLGLVQCNEYVTTTTLPTTIPDYNRLTSANFFFEPNQIYFPENDQGGVMGAANFWVTYDSATGICEIHRDSLTGTGKVTFNGNLYATAIPPTLVGTTTGGYNLFIDCTNVPNWQNLDIDNFIIQIKNIYSESPTNGTMTFSKSYDKTTGKLLMNRTSINGECIIQFIIDVYYIP